VSAERHLAMAHGAEFDAIRDLLAEWGPLASGIGDDAAVLDVPTGERVVISTDASIEEVHFRRAWLTAEEIGARAAAAALSDLAAMASVPRGLLLSLGVPESWRTSLTQIARGVGRVAASVECPIVGGNVSSADALSLTFTVVGSALSPMRRRGAKSGDIIFVTGTFGGPGAALGALMEGRTPADAHRRRFAAPAPRIAEARWLSEQRAVAGIDISDGLRGDAEHLARASEVSLVLNGSSAPRVAGVTAAEALASGEEYELLVAFRPDELPDRSEFERRFGLPLTAIGVAVPAGDDPVVITDVGVEPGGGFDHLRR